MKIASIAAGALLLAAAAPATAQNLVTNPGFETGSFAGWTQGGNTGNTGVTTGGYAHTGTFGASLGPVTTNGTLSQTLTTAAGASYDLSFWHFFSGSTPSYFEVRWNGAAVNGPFVNAVTPTAYTQTFVNGLLGTGSDTLTFVFRDDPSFQGLDDVSVTLGRGAVGGVPEPATWGMMLLGFGGLGYTLRRRKAEVRVRYA